MLRSGRFERSPAGRGQLPHLDPEKAAANFKTEDMGNQRKSKTYEEFVDKFKPRHTTDDCFTPANVYDAVVDWVVARFNVDKASIVRPFWPGKDYTQTDYPIGCTVVDNPPFSIISKIVRFYNDRGIRYFLFCNGLTALSLIKDKRATVIAAGSTITYDNGAAVNTNFVTNLAGDVLMESASDLHDAIEKSDQENLAKIKKRVRKFKHPHGTITAGGLNYLAVHHTPFKVMKRDAIFIRRLDCGVAFFGGGFLLSPEAAAERAAAERAAAERAAAEREAAEREAAEVLTLSDRERKLQLEI